MKRRYLYAILSGVPGLFLALIVSFLVSGFALGAFWLFLFGDNPWPAWTGILIPVMFAVVFLITWFAFLALGFAIGKQREGDPALNKKHIWVSIGITTVFILFIVFQQASVGNLGPKPDSAVCSSYCAQKGYAASSMPPRDSGQRNCSCLDQKGREIITIPLEDIDSADKQ